MHLSSRFASDLVVPASPGFELLAFERPSEGDPETFDITDRVKREVIVGWHLSQESVQAAVSPITTSDVDTNSWHLAFKGIRHPDGRVEWRSPLNEAVSAAIGQNRDSNGYLLPLHAASEVEWIGMVRKGWIAQLAKEEAERRRDAVKDRPCTACGRAHADDAFPF